MRIFLDNNLAFRHARGLTALLEPDHEVLSLRDKFPTATKDDEWLRALGREGGWIVISGDIGIQKSPHERLAWKESGLTIFFLSRRWMSLDLYAQHAKLALAIPKILETARKHPRGRGFLVGINGKIEDAF